MAKFESDGGFIVLHRKFREWQHYDNSTVKDVFLELLLVANHKPGRSRGFRCGRGETFVTIGALEHSLGLSRHTVIKALKTLVESGEITRTKLSQKVTKTTIVNYTKYQNIGYYSGANTAPQAAPQAAPQTAPQIALKQQWNNNNNGTSNVVVEQQRARTREEIVADFLAPERAASLEAFCMSNSVTVEQLRDLVAQVATEWELTGHTHKDLGDEQRHMIDQLRRKIAGTRKEIKAAAVPVEQRRARFYGECADLIKNHVGTREQVKDFFDFFTQPTADGLMLFENFDAWDTKTRFIANVQRRNK